MPVLSDAKREKFAQLVARGLTTIEAYVKAGFKRNTGNATAFRKRPEIIARVEEIQLEMQRNTEQDLTDYLIESGLTPTYIIKQMKEVAVKAKEAGKYDIAARTFKELGSELFGMFTERKHLTVDQNSVHTQTSTTINIEGLNSALEGLTQVSHQGPEIDGFADVLELTGNLISEDNLAIERARGADQAPRVFDSEG